MRLEIGGSPGDGQAEADAGDPVAAADGGRAAPADGVPAPVAALRSAAETGDWSALALFDNVDWVVVWFHVPHGELRRLLRAAPLDAMQGRLLPDVLLRLVRGEPLGPGPGMYDDPAVPRPLRRLVLSVVLRLQGRLAEALELAIEAYDELGEGETTLLDNSWGELPVLRLQLGITALLAGDLTRAEAWLLRAVEAQPGPLGFAARDAYAKLAVLHATFGSPAEARTALARGRALPRGGGWPEEAIDRDLALAEALLDAVGPLSNEEFPLASWRDAGELWPFALRCVFRRMLAAGDLDAVEHHLATLEAMRLPGAAGQGFSAAVLPLTRAVLRLAQGRPEEAAQALALAPPELRTTRLVGARVALANREWARATLLASAVAAEAGRFLQLRFEASAIVAAAMVMRDDADDADAADAVAALAGELGGIPLFVRRTIPVEVRDFAARQAASDPRLAPLAEPEEPPLFPGVRTVSLSPRERDVLLLLHTEAPIAEIAARLYLSVNTVKTHVRGIYRKLGVTTREDAVLAARAAGY